MNNSVSLFLVGLVLLTLPAFSQNEAALLSGTRQLTFEGKRAGESYFSADGRRLVFQSERFDENPFYQIYLMDLETGDTDRVSPGYGKTTCAWIHPLEDRVLFASTHLDPESVALQKQELEIRAKGEQRRYAWDYDEHYELFETVPGSNSWRQLTNATGYDAEGSWSPDGQWIAFASNRKAYSEPQSMTDEDRKFFEMDKAYMIDIYIMRADGSQLKQLTYTPGYDGGPFFDATGKRICWRRFSKDGATAEIYSMNIDGSDQQRLTHLEAMSWAPYYHPSGEYLIFATNKHGFANFELYLVDRKGEKTPVRVTDTDGFDGLPVFSPDGKTLAWTSNRSGSSQIQIAGWNHNKAMELLGLVAGSELPVAAADLAQTNAAIDAADLRKHVEKLASDAFGGRMTGTDGEHQATAYVASVFKALGLQPAGENGSWFQEFSFIAGVSLGEKSQLSVNGKPFQVDTDWRPLAFSRTGADFEGEVVFAGYGINAPAGDGFEEYDSFVHLDVKDKWVLVLRYMPENISAEQRQHMNRFADLRYKAMLARDKGALGLLVVSGPQSQVKEELVAMKFDASLAGTSIPAISITNGLAAALLASSPKDLATLQKGLDDGSVAMGFKLENIKVSASVDILQEKRVGRNTLARLYAGSGPGASAIVIGAHVDHLGNGDGASSLARDDERGQIHHGADDNASGVSGMLEIAQNLVDQKSQGALDMKHDLLFAAWSGEELGLLGSNYFVENFKGKNTGEPLRPEIGTYLNMDMIGRLDKNLIVQGLGSSDFWAGEVEKRNAPIGLPIVTQKDSYLPTDATSFYVRGVPILAAFTGSHEDYHTPRDTAEKLNYEGMKDIARFMGLVARSLVQQAETPAYLEMAKPEASIRAVMRAYLGTVPDYAQGDLVGVKLSGVAKGGPAETAGVRGGDIIIELAGRKVENIYDYTYAIEALKVGVTTGIIVKRGDEELRMEVTPGSRD